MLAPSSPPSHQELHPVCTSAYAATKAKINTHGPHTSSKSIFCYGRSRSLQACLRRNSSLLVSDTGVCHVAQIPVFSTLLQSSSGNVDHGLSCCLEISRWRISLYVYEMHPVPYTARTLLLTQLLDIPRKA